MTFEESYKYLLSLGNEVNAMKLGLESMTMLLHALGDPQNNYLKVQVAGTNGKGSVCSFVEAICVSAAIKVGVTTSPHLMSVTERVRVNGEEIGEAKFAELATRVRAAAEKLVGSGNLEIVPTYFEQVTAVALLAFAEAQVEIAILETGLGGRLDATTAAKAEIAVITRIDYDHQQYLGDTIEQIAAEKAAIIHRDSLVVIGEQSNAAKSVIEDRCSGFEIEPIFAGDVRLEKLNGGLRFTTKKNLCQVEQLGLLGEHQIENAKAAILVAEILSERFDIGTLNIEEGLQNARHPGRLEFDGRYLFDGAHNIGGAKALRRFLGEEVNKPITMIFGAMKDKDVEAIAEILFPFAKTLIVTPPNNERAMEPADLEVFAKKHASNIIITNSVADALSKAEALSTRRSVILVTGSLYLVGEAKRVLSQESKI